jgi:V8-like Glu-specific endopeptidase
MSSIQVVKEVLPPFVHYHADTEQGSSGSPVRLTVSS